MKFSKTVISFFVLSLSLSSFASELSYNCIGLTRSGNEFLGDVLIKGDTALEITEAKVVLNVGDRLITKEFKGSTKTAKGNLEISSVSLESTLQLEETKLSDLSDRLSLTIDSVSEGYSLQCASRN